MRKSSQLLLTFLLNACWQIALIAALASFGSWLLRNSVARYRHWIWVSSAVSVFSEFRLTTSWQILTSANLTATAFQTNSTEQPEIEPLVSVNTQVPSCRNSSVCTEAFLFQSHSRDRSSFDLFAISCFIAFSGSFKHGQQPND